MPEFKFIVSETRHVEMVYTVEAATEVEALDKASIGETTNEIERKDRGVTHRVVHERI